MSDLKKTIEEEYLINDVLKLILEAQRLDEFESPEDVDKLYKVAFDKLLSAPSQADVNSINIEKYNKIFGFDPFENIEGRLKKIQSVLGGVNNQNKTIPQIMNYLDVVIMMNKILYHYEDTTAGFLMEYLVAILVGGRIPPGNPIQDIEVVDRSGKVIKAYSLKTIKEKTGAGGSFNNLITFFKQFPHLDHISYLAFVKNFQGDEVVSYQTREVLVSLKTENLLSNEKNFFDLFDVKKNLSKDTAERQRYNALKTTFFGIFKAGGEKEQKAIDRFENMIKSKIDKNADLDRQVSQNITLEQVEQILKRLASISNWEGFENTLKRHLIQKVNTVQLQTEIASAYEELLKTRNKEDFSNLCVEFVRTGKIGKKAVSKRPAVSFKIKTSEIPAPEINEIEISTDSIKKVLTQNSELLSGLVKETYETLDKLNDAVNGFFRGTMYPSTAIRDTQRASNKMSKLSVKFKTVAKDVKPDTTIYGAGSQLDIDT